ncbi:3-oxoacyl-[acyl-carrier-protein] synthase III C-terminal domain-containing protein [Bradyrhizobium sp. UFLA05-109]
MSRIVAVGTALPPFRLSQSAAKKLARQHFGSKTDALGKYLTVFDHTLVDERFVCVKPEWFLSEHRVSETNEAYLMWAKELTCQATARCLERAEIKPEQVDRIIFISSTGIATPSLDVDLISKLGLRKDVKRTPVFGLGCAGGASGIGLAGAICRATNECILVATVELTSLTFQPNDLTPKNVVATSLFGDGAATVLIAPAESGRGKLEIVKSSSLLYPNTTSLMGWHFGDSGFEIVVSERIPSMVRELMPDALASLLAEDRIDLNQVKSLVFHPGGRKILEVFEQSLGRPSKDFFSSYETLRRHGNMSSATVLFVLDHILGHEPQVPGSYGILAAFGPGFSAEMSLLRWT